MPSWKNVAILLGARMANHAYCQEHPADKPDTDCPFCRDRASYQAYVKKVREG